MPRGDKSKDTDRQGRRADHVAGGYETRAVPEQEAERRAWATVNKDDGGGKAGGRSAATPRRRGGPKGRRCTRAHCRDEDGRPSHVAASPVAPDA